MLVKFGLHSEKMRGLVPERLTNRACVPRGHTEEVDRAVAQERREVRSASRAELRCKMGAPGLDLDESWRCTGTAPVLHWYYNGSTLVMVGLR